MCVSEVMKVAFVDIVAVPGFEHFPTVFTRKL